ncbi:MAG: type II secretion system protein [Clostridia bacterium]|nr:type II secretion system protein [Clostridia bacterium]
MNKRNNFKENGITLIALVVTIIVLLILAGITINLAMGSNGLIQKSKAAKEQTEIGKEKEIIALAYNSALSKKVSNGGLIEVTAGDLNTELTNQGASARGNPIKVTFNESKRQYTINTNGEIKYEGIKNVENNLSLAISTQETESRAILLRVSAEGGNYNDLSIDELQYTCNDETIDGQNAEFAITKPGLYRITATNLNGEYGEIIWNEYPASKAEEYSTIQNSNYKLSKDGYDVWIPEGFAYGTSENVGNVTKGLVITDSVEQIDGKNYSNGNEFVWIPVDKTNLTVGKTNKKMAEISSGTNYRGVLYTWNSNQTGEECYDPALGRKEPAYLTYSDSWSENTTGISEEILQQEYNNLIASIKEYGGFYVARYEMGDSSSDISRLCVTPARNLNWWNAYSKAKAYNKNGITSGMIWGSQWDAMLNFGLTNPNDSSKVTASTNGNHSYTILNTGMWVGPNNETDVINNIFDLEANVREWTMAAAIDGTGSSWSSSRRVLRGGSARYTCSAKDSGSYNPGDTEDSYLYMDYFCTRIMFYIDV